MIIRGKELMRINPTDNTKIQCSHDNGLNWFNRSTSDSFGKFTDLVDNGNEILGTTSKGLYFSRDNGNNWSKRS